MLRLRIALVGLALAATFQTTAADLPPPASDHVEALHSTLADAMARSSRLGCEGRIKLLQPVVDAQFDLPFIAERTLRRRWHTLDETQRQQLINALRQSVVTTYATEFATPGAVRFAIGHSENMPNGDTLVHSTLIPKAGAAITLDYVLRARAGRWQVVNVLADGVSDLALRATQYEALMKSAGFAALIARLETQQQALRARCQ